MHHSPDSLAARSAAAEARARQLRDTAATALRDAKQQLAKRQCTPVPKFDAAAAELMLAQARAADQVHSTDTAAKLERDLNGKRAEAAAAAERRASEVSALEHAANQRSIALAGADAVLLEAIENTRAVVASVASARLPAVRQAYRDALLAAMDMATDLWALEALSVDTHRPLSRAITTNAAPLVFPALACFGDEYRPALRAVGAEPNGPQAVVLNAHNAQHQALADVERIRRELTAATEGNV